MSFTAGLYATGSDRLYSVGLGRYVCDETGEPLSLVYDYEAMRDLLNPEEFSGRATRSLNRFVPFLPFEKADSLRFLNLDQTPIKSVPVSGLEEPVEWKDETCLRSGTTWSRGSAVTLGLCYEWRASFLFFANPGPAGLSLARYPVGKDQRVVVTLENYLDALDQFPATTDCYVLEDASREKLNRLMVRTAEELDGLLGTPGWNPYFIEGLKTTALELFEQFEEIPDSVYVGDRSALPARGITKGFDELKKLGWIDSRPRIVHVTREEAIPAERNEDEFFPDVPTSIDETITVDEEELETARKRIESGSMQEVPTGRLALAGYLNDPKKTSGSSVLVATGQFQGLERPDEGFVEYVEHLEASPEILMDALNKYVNEEG